MVGPERQPISTMTHAPLSSLAYRQIVDIALQEDLARGDLTTDAIVDAGAPALATISAREKLVLCGLDVARHVFERVDASLGFTTLVADGVSVDAGAGVAEVRGAARSILHGERVALNFLQRMSGVATLTASFVQRLPADARTRIVDTRKTTPGLRALERYAVRCGGGHNHRDDLAAAVLIKDNHIAAAGGIAVAIDRARARAPHTTRIECEVDNLDQLEEALESGADIIMLDNFSDGEVAKAVARIDRQALVEVSGGVQPDRVATLAALGVDIVSVGALTHSARAVDLGLDWG